MPSLRRGLPSIVVKRDKTVIMFDCGEGTQRRLLQGRVGVNREMKIFITHMHGDHLLGLPGLIQTMALLGRQRRLEIYGPRGLGDFLKTVDRHVPYISRFEVVVNEASPRMALDMGDYIMECVETEHSILSYGYALIEKERPGKFHPERARDVGVPEGPLWKRLQLGEVVEVDGKRVAPNGIVDPPRPGFKIVYSGDTRPCRSLENLSKGADVLIYDSTFDDSRSDKALEYGHSTSTQAAKLAKKAKVKNLILTHISAAYDEEGESDLLKQAQAIHPNTILAMDMMRLRLMEGGRIEVLDRGGPC